MRQLTATSCVLSCVAEDGNVVGSIARDKTTSGTNEAGHMCTREVGGGNSSSLQYRKASAAVFTCV